MLFQTLVINCSVGGFDIYVKGADFVFLWVWTKHDIQYTKLNSKTNLFQLNSQSLTLSLHKVVISKQAGKGEIQKW